MSVLESYYETQAFEVVNKAIEAAVEAIALEKSCNLVGKTVRLSVCVCQSVFNLSMKNNHVFKIIQKIIY